jgi:hypothetical protein
MALDSKSSERHSRAQRAKEFLISQVVEEAQREDVPLSEVERKMLYFTETQESLPDIYEVNDQFERECDDTQYERKIAGLLRNARKRERHESSDAESRWKNAIADLRKEDHYLLVMVDQSQQPVGDFWNLIAWGTGISVGLVIFIIFWIFLDQKGLIPTWVSTVSFSLRYLVWGAVAVWLVYKLLRLGALGDILKVMYGGLRSSLAFLRQKDHSGE